MVRLMMLIILCFALAGYRVGAAQVLNGSKGEKTMEILKKGGVDVTSNTAIIQATRNDDSLVRMMALQWIIANDLQEARQPLRELLQERFNNELNLWGDELYYICSALYALKDEQPFWKNVCRALLTHSDVTLRIKSAGLLARAGETSGWQVVQAGLTDSRESVVNRASRVVKDFAGKTIYIDGAMKNILALQTCINALKNADNELSQRWIVDAIADIATGEDTELLSTTLPVIKTQYDKDRMKGIIDRLKGKVPEGATITGPAIEPRATLMENRGQ